eukprot:CAMPEP_0194212198 /NCGR_PEP_ID=MMETSP0156-20130528/11914_1 /TAXON_ID=33649 /ORGANISM="Thalassionema nitzschioides, Strain L26-B" /LENGTH=178 /DNA_ID=CAMNT_0038939965 /DNA_START=798 /DNA_END=1333 /DNA_ORIENTATION=+
MPNPGLWSILNDIIEIDKNDWAAISTREIITTLAEIVTWSEEDLTKMEQGEDVGSLCKHNRQGPPSDQQEEQLRPPARREEIPMVLMHEQHQHLMMVRRQRRRLVNHRRLDNPGFAFVFGENALGRPQNNNVGAPPLATLIKVSAVAILGLKNLIMLGSQIIHISIIFFIRFLQLCNL